MAEVKYAISIKDGRLVFATREVAENPSFFVLHPDTVREIQKGKLTTRQVLVFIKNRPRTAAEIAKLKPENVRTTELPKPEAAVTDEDGIKIPVGDVTVANGSVAESVVVAGPGGDPVGAEGEQGQAGIPSKDELVGMKPAALRALAESAGKDVTGMNKSQMIDALTGAAE